MVFPRGEALPQTLPGFPRQARTRSVSRRTAPVATHRSGIHHTWERPLLRPRGRRQRSRVCPRCSRAICRSPRGPCAGLVEPKQRVASRSALIAGRFVLVVALTRALARRGGKADEWGRRVRCPRADKTRVGIVRDKSRLAKTSCDEASEKHHRSGRSLRFSRRNTSLRVGQHPSPQSGRRHAYSPPDPPPLLSW